MPVVMPASRAVASHEASRAEGKFVFADNTSFNVEAGLNFPL